VALRCATLSPTNHINLTRVLFLRFSAPIFFPVENLSLNSAPSDPYHSRSSTPARAALPSRCRPPLCYHRLRLAGRLLSYPRLCGLSAASVLLQVPFIGSFLHLCLFLPPCRRPLPRRLWREPVLHPEDGPFNSNITMETTLFTSELTAARQCTNFVFYSFCPSFLCSAEPQRPLHIVLAHSKFPVGNLSGGTSFNSILSSKFNLFVDSLAGGCYPTPCIHQLYECKGVLQRVNCHGISCFCCQPRQQWEAWANSRSSSEESTLGHKDQFHWV
jgi:hypothetical protein